MSKNEAVPAVSMRILKINTCPSLSGRSQLTYHIGCDAEGEIHFRVVANTGSGQFNADWVKLSMVEQLLSEHSATKPITSAILHPIFRFKSSNSPAFLFAALKAESMVLHGETKESSYTLGDITAFKQTMSALIAGDTDLRVPSTVVVDAPKRKRSNKEAA